MMPKRVLRRSQLITTFGPGAIVDLPRESVMIAGIDEWPHSRVIEEPRLQRNLKPPKMAPAVLREPKASDEMWAKDVPVLRFPRYHVCPKCNRLLKVSDVEGLLGSKKSTLRCPYCQGSPDMYPARFLMACENGHIDDFPWEWWVHRGGECPSGEPELYLYSLGRTAGLADIIVECKACDAKPRSMAGAFSPGALDDYGCTGRRPWLNDYESCEEAKPVTIQRGASNAYFPVSASALSIPEWSEPIQQALDPYWYVIEAIPENAVKDTLLNRGIPAALGVPVQELVRAVKRRKNFIADEPQSPLEMRYEEALALRQGSTDEGGDFECVPAEVHSSLRKYIGTARLVKRLREVRAIRGFTRIAPPIGDHGMEWTRVNPISRKQFPEWFPAIEVRGEGIYFELASEQLTRWENNPNVVARVEVLDNRYRRYVRKYGARADRHITPRFVLLHTLAHLLLVQLSLDCGYSLSSIRERVFSVEPGEAPELELSPVAGVLLYTATTDSDGSLGGLVRQGEKDRFAAIVQDALSSAQWCSSDPLCIESTGQGINGLNMAACHACALVPETCCEFGNQFLDRALVVGHQDVPGYFEGII